MMTPETWKKVKSIFNEASELPKTERSSFLAEFEEEIRLEVEKMLDAADEESLLLNNPIVDFKDFEVASIPDKIGDYKIIREIGHGGMGTVYEAIRETENFKQKVALKVIRRGMNNEIILKRFRAEQQILSSLEHPNIGRFLDGGKSFDGLPFYAMEFIEGLPIDEFCRQKNLSIEEKIKLFREVCSAVSYAHTNLIVHRDLKPSNIIVTEKGIPKLLDFGIAKVLDVDSKGIGTATQLGMMTPQYASPEQIRGEKVTTLSDVYSLGIIFYEILTGEKPYQTEGKNYAEILEIITQTNVTKPSENRTSKIRNPKLKGDLDTIAVKAIQKLPERRYNSVEQFSEDLRRHLVGLPITARPDTFQYRFSKFVERNKISVAAGILVFLSLVIGISVASWQAYRAEKQRLLAEKRFAEVRTIANNFVYKYTDEISALPNSMQIRQKLLQDGSDYLDKLAEDSADDFTLQKELALAYTKLGNLQGKPNATSLGDTVGAIGSYEKAIRLLENVYQHSKGEIKETSAVELIKTYRLIGVAFSRANEDKEKRKTYSERSRAILNEVQKEFPQNPVIKIELLRIQLSEAGKLLNKNFAEGEEFYNLNILPVLTEIELHPGLEIAEKSFIVGFYTNLSWLFNERAKLLFELDNNSENAQRLFLKSLEFSQKAEKFNEEILLQNPQDIQITRGYAVGLTNLAIALYNLRRFDESAQYLHKSLKLFEEVATFDQQNVQAKLDLASVYSEFGILHHKKGEYSSAINYLEKSLQYFDEVIAKDANNLEAVTYKIDILLQLIETQAQFGQFEKALNISRQTEDLWQKSKFESNYGNNQLGKILLKRGVIFKKLSRFPAAKAELQKSLEIMRKFDSEENQLLTQIVERELQNS